MIVKKFTELAGTKRQVQGNMFVSNRLLLEKDGMGFTLTDSRPEAGFEMDVHYKHHLEAVYVIDGEATIINLETNESVELKPGVMICFDKNEKHRYKVHTPMRLICIFNPPLTGSELHREDGSYEPNLTANQKG